KLLLKRRGRIAGVLAARVRDGGTQELIRIYAEHVFLCAGPTETPALLRRSGMKFHVGDSLRIHPMLKIATLFPEEMNSQGSVLPLLQVKEFWPEVSMGGAFFSAGHLAMGLSENWPDTRNRMADHRRMAIYYTAVRGTGKGSVRPSMFGDSTHIRYELSSDDLKHLSQGLGRLSTLLLAAGAEEIYPSVFGVPVIRREIEAVHWLDEMLPRSGLSLTTVHAFSACPIGERMDRCAADSFGKLHHFDNVYVNDASMLPDSPGVNPQGSIMALARRNAIRFADGVR
ncbi:MAG: GMC oxidoreductase, partial [Candidatus Latescibacteria bacterium]|nr:GMC oxidoreductase [Candidatus Latescibacterota bacterium]